MTSDRRLDVQAWVISGVLHGLVLVAAFALVSQVRPLRSQDTFRWEVSLVEATKVEPDAQRMEALPTSSPPRSQVKPQVRGMVPQMITRHVHTEASEQVVQRDVPQVVEAPKPIERTEGIQTRQDPVAQEVRGVQAEDRQAHRIVERVLESTVQSAMVVQAPNTTASDSEIIESASPVSVPLTEVQKGVHGPVSASAMTPLEPVQRSVVGNPRIETKGDVQSIVSQFVSEAAEPVQQGGGTIVAKPVEARRVPAVVDGHALDQQPGMSAVLTGGEHATQSDMTVTEAMQPRPSMRADYGWLAESLWRRVAELKRYPSSARLNGWEGRVVLRAVIRSDGHLADISVQNSSGYDALDKAAIEAVRLACPLHMKHELGRPEVAVSLPIVYSLSH